MEIPLLLPEGFHHDAEGSRASINSMVFYTCPLCHCCVVEHGQQDANRKAHIRYHKEKRE